jgi:glycosyltransferase involved in cell wall biosynthesis
MASDDMAQREIAAIFRCDLTLVISQFEIDLLVDYFAVPAQLLHYCPFLQTRPLAHTSVPAFEQREHFVAIGNFRHEPNWDAVLYLKHAVWPLIHNRVPQAQLHIYGAYPPPKATQLHNPKQGFHVKGWADNALDVMRHARVCLAPLRFGAGIKGKLMDAMRCGTPSVTTDIGAEAMSSGLPWGGLLANSAADIAEAAVQLYREQPEWLAAQARGSTILHEYFARDDYAMLLLQRFGKLQQQLAQEREQNFIGAMLRHHSMKSTQYMSQWIEAKSKNFKQPNR